MAYILRLQSAIPTLADSQAQHYRSMQRSLEHRLAVARSTRNTALIAQLEQERQQLELAMPLEKVAHWLENLPKKLAQLVLRPSTSTVREYTCGTDQWWYAFDTHTHRWVYGQSEIEVSLQLQQSASKTHHF
ncbi:MAG TPA: hypothetical protein V6D19_24940 [Stenomitos sp.]